MLGTPIGVMEAPKGTLGLKPCRQNLNAFEWWEPLRASCDPLKGPWGLNPAAGSL